MFLFGENTKQSADSLATSHVLTPSKKTLNHQALTCAF